MCDAESCKLDLTGLAGGGDVVYDPVIKGSVRFELERAEGVRDAFQCVFDRMCEVVHRIDAPLCACSVMRQVIDPVDNGISHVEVAGCEIDLGAERHLAVLEFAGSHSLEEV